MRLIVLFALAAGAHAQTPEPHKVGFTKHVLTTDFASESAAVADVDRDGDLDVLAGSHWYAAPGWTPHEIRPPQTFDPNTEWSDSFVHHAIDVDQDGWTDLVRTGFPGEETTWYRNPGPTGGHWPEQPILARTGNESPQLVDLDGDGRGDLLLADYERRQMLWLRAPAAPGDTAWTATAFSVPDAPGTNRFSHGLGAGDLTGDGRADVMVREGYWEQPADPEQAPWTFHEADLGKGAAQMYAYDFDRDGDADVVSSSAHDYGIWWHERTPDGFRTHLIDDRFSQTHALALVDVDGDGRPDLVTGKRYFAHNGKDPGGHEPAVLYWYRLGHGADGHPTWTPHQIDDDSGVGLTVTARDVTGDGLVDIVAANKKGVFVFEQERR